MSHSALVAICIVGCFLFSYLIGSAQPALLLGIKFYGKDLREEGSNYFSATNAFRVFGFEFGFICLLVDITKGAVAVLFTKLVLTEAIVGSIETSIVLQLISGVFAILGHNYPCWMGFRGGKGVALSLGVCLIINWKVFLIAAIPALLGLVLSKRTVLASLMFDFFSLVGYIAIYYSYDGFYWITLSACLYPLISFYRHRNNLIGVINGEREPLWGEKEKEPTRFHKTLWGSIENVTIPAESKETKPKKQKSKNKK